MKKKQLLAQQQALREEIARLREENLRLRLHQPQEIAEVPPEEPPEELEAPAQSGFARRFSRFPLLRAVDEAHDPAPPAAEPPGISLRELAAHMRGFAAARYGLFAARGLFPGLLGAMAVSDAVVVNNGDTGAGAMLLQAAAESMGQQAELVAVARGWRGPGALLGEPNGLTGAYRETRLLRTIYQARYETGPRFLVLDNLTASPPEQYLAPLWALAQMAPHPRRALRLAENAWPGDPRLLRDGLLEYPETLWLFGTVWPESPALRLQAPMELTLTARELTRQADGEAARPSGEEPVLPKPVSISAAGLRTLFAAAREEHPLPEEVSRNFSGLADYLARQLDRSTEPGLERQLSRFVSVCLACGLRPAEATDAFLFHKALRCLKDCASLQDELPGLQRFLAETFGKTPLAQEFLRAFINPLQKND